MAFIPLLTPGNLIPMGLFKSKDERRVEREMKIRAGMRAIERSIRQQEKFADDFIKNARRAKQIGDDGQYQFIRGALKKTAAVKKMLERQLLSIRNAMLIQQQAAASQQFAESMTLMAREIARTFGETDLTKTQAQWERAVAQAGSLEERMDLFLDSMEQSATTGGPVSAKEDLVTDDEIDRLIAADVLAGERAELSKLDELESEIAKELGAAKQRD
ncbi:MAG TPA: hypothetical protein VK324_02925 [Tepidisphaeraceae bacterium]|nr:hypothetical protein [Tepidisphaeraceae bacterium]